MSFRTPMLVRTPKRLFRILSATALAGSSLAVGWHAQAQLSLSSAVELAQRNSPRVQMAQADVARSRASLGLAKDAFIPAVITSGGYGRSTGAPLGVPVIYSISAQSLIYSFSQSDYIRSAHAGLDASLHALYEAKIEVTEDTTNTYLALNSALQRRDVLQQSADLTERLVNVIQDRLNAGVDTRMELTRTRITAAQIRLQLLSLKDEIAADTQHLASLTGLPTMLLTTEPQSIPAFSPLGQSAAQPTGTGYSEGVAAAYAAAKAKQLSAKGDRRYLLLPQISLQANYSRVDTALSSYSDYYPRFNGLPGGPPNSENSLGFGAALTIPILDFAHRSKARESAADAAHALADARQQESAFLEGRARLQNSTLELDARADLARLNQQLAQDQLITLRVQMEPGAGALAGPPVTPKDELNAELQERLRYLDVLNADLQLQQTRINLLRQQGGLGDFIHQSLLSTPSSPTVTPASPTVPGIPAGGTPPVIPSSGVTGGSLPNPATAPNPAAPAGQPHP